MIVKPKRLILFLAGVLLLFVGAAIFLNVPSAESITSALNDTIIEQFAPHDATAAEAFSIVMNHVYEKHPELRKVRLDYYPTIEAVRLEHAKSMSVSTGMTSAPEWSARMSFSLTKITAAGALKYSARNAGLEYTVSPGKIYIYAPVNPPPPSLDERLDSIPNWFRSLFSRSSAP